MIIGNSNKKYKNINLYTWILGTVKNKYSNNQLVLDEIQIIEKLTGKSLDELYCGRKEPVKVKVVDVVENKKIGVFESQHEASRVMRDKYNVKLNSGIVGRCLTGKTTTPYKGRFMFYRVDENEEATE